MPPGRYGARHAARWSASVASCEATRCRHRACARAVSARRTPWSSSLPSCQNTNKTQLLASDYCTFLLAELNICVTRKGPSTHVIDAPSFFTMWDATTTIQEEVIVRYLVSNHYQLVSNHYPWVVMCDSFLWDTALRQDHMFQHMQNSNNIAHNLVTI